LAAAVAAGCCLLPLLLSRATTAALRRGPALPSWRHAARSAALSSRRWRGAGAHHAALPFAAAACAAALARTTSMC
jgi:hypothetical protein